jgi:hypothetical protein
MDQHEIKRQVLKTLLGASSSTEKIHRYWAIHEIVTSDAPLTPEHAQYLENWLNSTWTQRAKTLIGPDGNIYNASHSHSTLNVRVDERVKRGQRKKMREAQEYNYTVIHEKTS